MTRAEVLSGIAAILARPNTTYQNTVIPLRLNKAIRDIQSRWDWKIQFPDLGSTYKATVANGSNYVDLNAYLLSLFPVGSYITKVFSKIYNVADEYLCEYKDFNIFLVSDTSDAPRYFTPSFANNTIPGLWLSAKVTKASHFFVPAKIIMNPSDIDYGSGFDHPFTTIYPEMLIDYTVILCKRDFLDASYTMKEWLADFQQVIADVQKTNDIEKKETPSIVDLNILVNKYGWLDAQIDFKSWGGV
jgi:hypothetical protein